jgi:osmoprotectant transport system substrate-binding protein
VGLIFSSDGSVEDLDLVVLEDDRHLQNVDNVTPAVLTAVAVPQVMDALNGLSAVLTTADLVALNQAVDVEGTSAANAAAAWLAEKGLD